MAEQSTSAPRLAVATFNDSIRPEGQAILQQRGAITADKLIHINWTGCPRAKLDEGLNRLIVALQAG
ncbi:MAG: hypothetical protein QM578_20610 [Pantoea sp.]|uniref:hypothetical protein n=1 Tax=Pantoea sp. TaxID=69393 RepID=UPI0039E59E08